MANSAESRPRCVVLVGNPNTGKSTLFNALSGLSQHVGNYPGVTVEKKTGRFRIDGQEHLLVDLPGTYSLAPRSLDEMVTVDILLGRRQNVPPPDLILCVVDASNLERNLYLVTQLLALELPIVLALNMNDVAERNGISVDARKLSHKLGIPVARIQAQKRHGLDSLKNVIRRTTQPSKGRGCGLHDELDQAIEELQRQCTQDGRPSRFVLERLLLDESDQLRDALQADLPDALFRRVEKLRAERGTNGSFTKADAAARYAWIERQLEGVSKTTEVRSWFTDRVDGVLLHPILGLFIALALLLVLFQAVFTIAEPASALIDILTGIMSPGVSAIVPEGPLRSLLTDGLIAGVGGVLVFLPQILLLFFFIALLEDSGYLARVACLMDRLMSRVGLSGKSFIPLLSSFACAIPGIMAARVIENRRDRLVTILISPLMCCSARLPVYTLLIAAFIPDQRYLGGLLGLRGLTMLALYLLGIVVAVAVAFVLKKSILRGETPSFLLEIPSFKWPSVAVVTRKVWDGGWAFMHGAGTLIVAVTVLVWAAAYFPHGDRWLDADLIDRRDVLLEQLSRSEGEVGSRLNAELDQVEKTIRGARLRVSFLGRAGRFIEPVVKPLGWDWRIGCAVIASFPAREVVVATMGVLYNLGNDQDEESESLRETLRKSTWEGSDRPVFNVPVALSVMVFFALCAQCFATLAVMRRETNSWRWPIFVFVYMTTLAYLAALVTYQVGMLFVG